MVEKRPMETSFGLALTILAAVLAFNELMSGKYGTTELKNFTDKSQAYQWYQAKSIKQTQVEGQRDLLNVLLKNQAIKHEVQNDLKAHLESLDQRINTYRLEKKEILLGSRAVGKENWAQSINGEMGKIVGALEVEKQISELAQVLDRFDLATLFLQLSLLIGAMGLLLQKHKLKLASLTVTVFSGFLGVSFNISGMLGIFKMGLW